MQSERSASRATGDAPASAASTQPPSTNQSMSPLRGQQLQRGGPAAGGALRQSFAASGTSAASPVRPPPPGVYANRSTNINQTATAISSNTPNSSISDVNTAAAANTRSSTNTSFAAGAAAILPNTASATSRLLADMQTRAKSFSVMGFGGNGGASSPNPHHHNTSTTTSNAGSPLGSTLASAINRTIRGGSVMTPNAGDSKFAAAAALGQPIPMPELTPANVKNTHLLSLIDSLKAETSELRDEIDVKNQTVISLGTALYEAQRNLAKTTQTATQQEDQIKMFTEELSSMKSTTNSMTALRERIRKLEGDLSSAEQLYATPLRTEIDMMKHQRDEDDVKLLDWKNKVKEALKEGKKREQILTDEREKLKAELRYAELRVTKMGFELERVSVNFRQPRQSVDDATMTEEVSDNAWLMAQPYVQAVLSLTDGDGGATPPSIALGGAHGSGGMMGGGGGGLKMPSAADALAPTFDYEPPTCATNASTDPNTTAFAIACLKLAQSAAAQGQTYFQHLGQHLHGPTSLPPPTAMNTAATSAPAQQQYNHDPSMVGGFVQSSASGTFSPVPPADSPTLLPADGTTLFGALTNGATLQPFGGVAVNGGFLTNMNVAAIVEGAQHPRYLYYKPDAVERSLYKGLTPQQQRVVSLSRKHYYGLLEKDKEAQLRDMGVGMSVTGGGASVADSSAGDGRMSNQSPISPLTAGGGVRRERTTSLMGLNNDNGAPVSPSGVVGFGAVVGSPASGVSASGFSAYPLPTPPNAPKAFNVPTKSAPLPSQGTINSFAGSSSADASNTQHATVLAPFIVTVRFSGMAADMAGGSGSADCGGGGGWSLDAKMQVKASMTIYDLIVLCCNKFSMRYDSVLNPDVMTLAIHHDPSKRRITLAPHREVHSYSFVSKKARDGEAVVFSLVEIGTLAESVDRFMDTQV